jgi:tellurite resistance protein
LIPTISSNEISTSIKAFTNFDPSAMMGELTALQTETDTSQHNLRTAADAAMMGGTTGLDEEGHHQVGDGQRQ